MADVPNLDELKKLVAQRKKQYEYHNQRRLRKKQELVLRLGGKCVICGLSSPMSALEFHHRPGAVKKSEVARLLAGGRFREAEEESRKCVLLCANCHRAVQARTAALPDLGT